MKPNANFKIQICSIVALVGGILGIAYGIGFPMIDWGRPGSEAYTIYQNYNRLELIPLGLQLVAMSYFLWHLRIIIGNRILFALAIFILGFLLRISGVIGEFWIFTTEPYSSDLRSNSYSLTGVGGNIGLIALIIIGIVFWRFEQIPKWFSVFLILSPILLFVAVLMTLILESTTLNPVTVEGVIQGVIWMVLGVFILRADNTRFVTSGGSC